MAAVQEMPPVGHYVADEAGQLAGVSGNTIGQWRHHGYIEASQHSGSYPLVYSYQDVAEAIVVHELVLEHVAMADIRETIKNLRAEYGPWPLNRAPLHAESGILALNEDGRLIDFGRRPGQGLILEPDDLARVRTALNRGGWAARDLPDLRYIEVNPNRLSGVPVIRGHRVAAEQVARLALEDDDGRQVLRDEYDLNDAEIADAVRWWDRVQKYGHQEAA